MVSRIRAGEMAEYRSDLDIGMGTESRYELVKIPLFESEPVHARIQLNVDHARLPVKVADKRLQNCQVIYFWFKSVSQQFPKTFFGGVHYHYPRLNIVAAQLCPLIGKRDTQEIHLMVLQNIRDLYASATISERLHHDH